MTLLFTDTFCGNDLSQKWTSATGSGLVIAADAMATNGISIQAGTGSGDISKTLAVADRHRTIIAGAAFNRVGGSIAMVPLITIGMSNGASISLQLNTDRTLRIFKNGSGGDTGVLAQTTEAYFPLTGAPYYVEFKLTLNTGDSVGTDGLAEVKIDGVTVLSYSGRTWACCGSASLLTSVGYTIGGSISSYYHFKVFDVYICNGAGAKNNDFLNAPKIVWLKPTGTGTNSQGIGSDGDSVNNYALVDDGPMSLNTADYVDLLATGDKDLYTFADVAGLSVSNEVLGVGIWAHAQKNDTGTRTFVGVARSGANEVDTPAQALAAGTYQAVGAYIDTKPGGGTWTVADLNAMEFGAKAGT